jgi:protein-S-isoprenylcysteine O-methyltransferase Ste14
MPSGNRLTATRDPWVWGQVFLFVAIGAGAPLVAALNLGRLDPLLGQMDPKWLRLLGIPLAAVGLVLIIAGARALGRSLTPATEPLAEGRLIQTGIYARIRNPIYAGVILVLAGYTLWWTNWRLALIVGWIVMLYLGGKSRTEERKPAARFPEYEAYRRRVPKFFPF